MSNSSVQKYSPNFPSNATDSYLHFLLTKYNPH